MKKLFILIILPILFNCQISDDAEENIIEEKSDAKELTLFTLKEPKVIGKIKGGAITLVVPDETDITQLIPLFEFNGDRVEVNNIVQDSGVTINDFTKINIYTVIAEDDSRKEYKIDIRFINSLEEVNYPSSSYILKQGEKIAPIKPDLSVNHIVTYSIKPDLPEGLNLNSDSGEISGIPKEYCYDATEYTITTKSYLDEVNTKITIHKIIPIPPKITLSEYTPILKRYEVYTIQILNSGGPIEDLKVSNNEWYEIDQEKRQLILKPNRNKPSFHYRNPFDDLAGIKITASNSGGESSKYLTYTLEKEKKVSTKPYLNVEEIFNEMYELDREEIITETLLDVTNMEYRLPTFEWRSSSFFNYSFDGEVRREIPRKEWLHEFPYVFRQTENEVFVRRKSSSEEVEYAVDIYKSDSDGLEKILFIEKIDSSSNLPDFFQFRHLHYKGSSKINSLRDEFYISIPESENFTFSKKYNDIDFIESRPVVVTKGIQRLSEIKLEEDGYRGNAIWPSSVSTDYINTLSWLILTLEKNSEPEDYYIRNIEPFYD